MAGTTAALTVEFAKSMDHKSLLRLVTIHDGQGDTVAGTVTIGAAEKSWSFAPKGAWKNQDYTIRVSGRLEDVAGNTPQRPFDLYLQAPAQPAQRLEIPFRPRR